MDSNEFTGFEDPTIEPPEVREPNERFRLIEFYVDLSNPRPDIELFDLVKRWLSGQAPLPVNGLMVSYHRETEDEPPMMVGLLLVGEPIDVG